MTFKHHTDVPVAARFQTRNAYYIVGIGHILTGEVLEGTIACGNHITLQVNNEEVSYLVTAVETIEYMTAGTSETALILELIEGDNKVNYLEDIAGEVVDIAAAG